MRQKRTPSDREMMELAVRVMRDSVPEPRGDGKASPKVGAVLLKPDGTVETASRGELRQGDHAEYTLLERKNRGSKLDGSILYATLEPCAPNARSFPKLGCAERIVLARITEVWVGIEDPDPTVDRKGIKHLQDNGIDVHMFDRDLQEMISDENTAFMAQAMARASADDGQREVTLSPLEEAAGSVDLSDLSDEALQAFCTRADIAHAVGSSEFVRRLAHMGLLTQDRGTYRPTGFGVVLFGREPRVTMPQTGLLATIRYDDGTEEPMAFEGPQVLAPEAILGWLRAKLPNPTVRSEARRRESNAAVFEILREAVVNALVHRDYGILGAKCQLTITPNEFVVRSPGSPVPPITLQQMQAFGAPMLSRNPVLHYVFAQMDLAEERGLGLRSIAKCAEQAGLPRPRYEFDAPYLVLTVFRSRAAATASLPDDAQAALSESMRPGWEWLSSNVRATSTQYAEAMGVDQRTARRHLEALMALGLVTKVGKTRGARYEVR